MEQLGDNQLIRGATINQMEFEPEVDDRNDGYRSHSLAGYTNGSDFKPPTSSNNVTENASNNEVYSLKKKGSI